MNLHTLIPAFTARDTTTPEGQAPLQIGILNLMPDKKGNEARFRDLLPQARLSFIRTQTYRPKNTEGAYLEQSYRTWPEVAPQLDALIITGAPLGQKDFTDVAYWGELSGIVQDAARHKIPVLALCWGAFAVAHIMHGIGKRLLPRKAFGNYKIRLNAIAGAPYFGKSLTLPVSRYAAFNEADVAASKQLQVIGETDGLGSQVVWDARNRFLLCAAHPEYAPDRLEQEYQRDLAKGLDTAAPENDVYAASFIAWQGTRFFTAWEQALTGWRQEKHEAAVRGREGQIMLPHLLAANGRVANEAGCA